MSRKNKNRQEKRQNNDINELQREAYKDKRGEVTQNQSIEELQAIAARLIKELADAKFELSEQKTINAQQQTSIDSENDREDRQDTELEKLRKETEEVTEYSDSSDGSLVKTVKNKFTGVVISVEIFKRVPHSI